MFRKLKNNEIECRIQSLKTNGLILLLYKDARCDMNILDETVGAMNWKREHTRENANCIVSIWDEEKKQWISKEDTGTESNTEKEKGLASDSFKRACFNWGIGRELYTSPFIWISSDKCNIKNNKCNDKFAVAEIDYNENGEISRLKIKNETTKKICFEFGLVNSNQRTNESKLITEQQQQLLFAKAKGKDTTKIKEILTKHGFKNSNSITKDKFNDILVDVEKIK